MYTVRHKQSLPTCEVLKRAKSLIGQSRYNIIFNTCEHFAQWCIVGGPSISKQAALSEVATLVGTSGLALLLGTAALGPVGGVVAACAERYISSFPDMHPDYSPLHCHYILGIVAYPQPVQPVNEESRKGKVSQSANQESINSKVRRPGRGEISSLPGRALLVLEDVDVLFNEDRKAETSSSVTFSGLLNAIDGLISVDGIITITWC